MAHWGPETDSWFAVCFCVEIVNGGRSVEVYRLRINTFLYAIYVYALTCCIVGLQAL